MISSRVLQVVFVLLALGSIAMAAAWQFVGESDEPASVAIAPSSRSMFPKVLNH